MCGIAGFSATPSVANSEALLRRMMDVISHRGPDDAGVFTDDFVALGHRRLSIIDVAAGHQPMSNQDGSSWIVYNGEVFNHAEIRPQLEQAGYHYQTRCDTETILHAYEAYGTDCLRLFRGMFAFAIWNPTKRQLFCARDRLGIKPFYYYWDGRIFVFASEIKALVEHPAVPTQFDESLLSEYLGFGYVSGENTLFRGIRKLMPGHHLTLDLRGGQPQLKIQQYWDVPEPAQNSDLSEADWIAETRRRLEETVRMRLMSDVPLGMFLSGGVDSSAIAALTKRLTNGPVKTFSVGYGEKQFSELSYAEKVARSIGTDHHSVIVGIDDFFAALPRLIWHEDEPISWPSSVSLYFVSKLAAEQVKVVLTGEGSDELFGGYERYRWNIINSKAASAYNLLPSFLRSAIRSQIAFSPLLKASLRRKLGHTFLGRNTNLESLFLDNFYCAFSQEQQKKLLNRNHAAIYENYKNYFGRRSGSSLLSRMLYADQKTYLVELLMKQDQMSMACSLESRVPFLDHQFVEFSTSIPDRMKIRGTEQKYILKKAVEDLLPHEIIYRKKMGFPTPIRQWLRDDRAQPIYAALQAKDGFLASFLDAKQLGALLDRHLNGVEDATDRIWRLFNLQLWGDLFLTGRRDRWWNGVVMDQQRETASITV